MMERLPTDQESAMSESGIFKAAVQLPPEHRAAYLDEACGSDAELRGEVESLLRAHDTAGSFLQEHPRPLEQTGNYEPIAERPGTVVGPYKLLEQIGEGGFGVVFLAEQREPVRRRVALKILKPGMDTRQIVARFEAERQALAIMDHPNIAKVFDGGTTPAGYPYFVMELVKGVPITEFCDENCLTPRQRLELFIPVCQAVQHAHQKGLIHRDLKPSNVLVSRHDTTPMVKVIDFGVAKAMGQELTAKTLYTGMAQMIGTPLYMSPEQAGMSDLDIDTRSDVYSLGVLLYELLTGTTPFTRERFTKAAYDEIRRIIREEEPPKPSTRLTDSKDSLPSISAQRHTEPGKLTTLVRGDLDWMVMKCLEKDRDRRYESANGLAHDIERHLHDEPVLAGPPSPWYRFRKFARRNRGALVAAALVLVALVGGIIGTTWGMFRAQAARRDAVAAQQAEAERADGERQAKQRALDAADAENAAKEQAQRRLTQIEKGNAVLTSVFDDLDIRKVRAGTEPLEAVLAKRLIQAAGQLEGESVGDPLMVAGLQYELGTTLLSLGFPADAIPLFEKARKTRSAQLGPDHPDTLTSMNNLALSRKAVGQLAKALPLYEETLKLKKAKLGADHPSTLQTMNNLGEAYRVAGQLHKALPLFEETLKLQQATLGADHPDTLISMNNLAVSCKAAGQLDKALPLFEETLKLQQARLGADHPDALGSMSNLANGYLAAGQLDKALPLFEDSLKLRKAKLGADHPSTLQSMNNLGEAYRVAGQVEKALPLLEETLKLQQARLGADHSDTLASMNNLANCYHAAGQPDKAVALLEETLKLKKARLGAEHPSTLLTMANLAGACEAVKQFDKAELLHRERLPLVKQAWGAESPAYAGALAMLGANLLCQKKWTDADPLLRECLAIRQKTQPDLWMTFDTQALLGGALLGQMKYADAEPLLRNGYEGMKQREKLIPEQRKSHIPEAIERLIQLYEATDKQTEAVKWRKELEAIKAAAHQPGKP
jgi:serine/threonine protein kinase/lipopolysaccharide biosynthesis regulator YciM